MKHKRTIEWTITLDQDTDILLNPKIIKEAKEPDDVGVKVKDHDAYHVCTKLVVHTGNVYGVDCRGRMYVDGGMVTGVTAEQGARITIVDNGKVYKIKEYGGCVAVAEDAVAEFTPVTFGGQISDTATVHQGTAFVEVTVMRDAHLAVYSGGVAKDVHVYGSMEISADGTAGQVEVFDGAVLTVYEGGVIQDVVIHKGGTLSVYEDAVLTNVRIEAGAKFYPSTCIHDKVTIEEGAEVYPDDPTKGEWPYASKN